MDMTKREEDFNLVVMNFSGRFNNTENRVIGQHVATQILIEKNTAVFFGQQSSFLPNMPSYYKLTGLRKAFIAYDKNKFYTLDDQQFHLEIKELQKARKFPLHYLSDSNYSATKLRSKFIPRVNFIALSWVTNESIGHVRSLSTFRKLMTFIHNLTEYENMPIIVGGSFRITPDIAVEYLPPGFSCYSYVPETPRRASRAASFFVCTDNFQMEGIRPLSCGNVDPPKAGHRWVNPEEALYCDPVLASVIQPNASELQSDLQLKLAEEPQLEYEPEIPTPTLPETSPQPEAEHASQNGLTEEQIKQIAEIPKQFRTVVLPSRLPRTQNKFTVPTVPTGLYRAEIHSLPKLGQTNGTAHRIKHSPEPTPLAKVTASTSNIELHSINKLSQTNGEQIKPTLKRDSENCSSGRPDNDIAVPSKIPRAASWSGSLYDEDEINKNTWCYMS